MYLLFIRTYPQGYRPAADGRATKGKRPSGQARRLTSPDLAILCRIATWGRSLTIWHVPQYCIPCKNKKQPPTKLLFHHKETRCPPIPYAQ